MWSTEPEAIQRPSGLTATAATIPLLPFNDATGCAVSTLQSLINESTPPQMIVRPSGMNATLRASSRNVTGLAADGRFQSFTVSSDEALARCVPSGLKAMQLTPAVCPVNVRISAREDTSQSLI